MTRQTSIDAYNYIKSNGSLSERRWEIYDVLFSYGPLTGGEIGRHLNDYRSAVSTADRNIHARLSELKKMTLISEVGQKECEITKMKVILWDVTPNMPIKLERKKTKNEIIKDLIKLSKLALQALAKADPDMVSEVLRKAKE